MKLNEFHRDLLTVEGAEVSIYVELDAQLPSEVLLDFDVRYEQADGRPARKTLTRKVKCEETRIRAPATSEAERACLLSWTVDLHLDDALREQLVEVTFKSWLRRPGERKPAPLKAMYPVIIVVVGIEITTHKPLQRIMLHEFSTKDGAFDPAPVRGYLDGLTPQQRQVLLNSAWENREGPGRLVIFISLYRGSNRRMYADWTNSTASVVPNATFSLFFCRNDSKLKLKEPPLSRSPITLVCHTEYFCLNSANGQTRSWLSERGIYDGKRANVWMQKTYATPPRFVIAALKPAEKVSYAVIWNAIYEAKSRKNIMPGNSVHGIINTQGCWMLFRNFNWPIVKDANGVTMAEKLDRVYREVYRPVEHKQMEVETPAITAALKGADYYLDPPPPRHSSSFDKLIRYDRNWAYEWFFHDVVGIAYYSNKDYWGHEKAINDYKVGGHEVVKNFPLAEADTRPSPYAYHDFKHKGRTIGPDLFQENALGIKTASDFVEDMGRDLTPAEVDSRTWADVYFYKDAAVNAEQLGAAEVTGK